MATNYTREELINMPISEVFELLKEESPKEDNPSCYSLKDIMKTSYSEKLAKQGVYNTNDLVKLGRYGLLKLPGVGRKLIRVIALELEERGIYLPE